MSMWNVFSLIGGLAIFLFGMMEMNKNLTMIAGSKMKTIMARLTDGPVRGYLTGLGITIVNQSSSATTVLEAALVGAGLMTFHQSLAVTLGAELGSTFLPQLIAFPSITKFSTLIVFVGFVYRLVAKTKRSRYIAMTIFMFGLLFLGMDMMSTSLKPLREFEPFIRLMATINSPVLGILIGLVFTMIIQSSGATTSITIAMAIAGAITVEQAVPINLGAAVGTCITAILGSLTLNWEAKRSSYIHVLFQLIGVVWVFILLMIPYEGERLYIWMIKWVTLKVFGTDSVARQIAMGFTFMPIINHIIVFPNLRLIVKLFNSMFPEREAPKPFGALYLEEALIGQSVDLALMMARKEIIRVTDFIAEMIKELKGSFKSKDDEVIPRVSELDSKVDILHSRIIPFLATLSQEELDSRQSQLSMNYLYIQNELESIGDIIDKNIMKLVQKKINQNVIFSEEGFHEIQHLVYKIHRNFDFLQKAIRDDEIKYVKTILELHKNKEEEKYKQLHIERLFEGKAASIATSSIHLDLISYFARINKHIAYIASRLQRIM
ncbi:MAG: Na/Pi cotransporter family protein [Sphaerochaetaceae bacterium]|nr:Na/Pi cotransporter family protein [Sphaerochaetaceae bacterium]